MENSEVVIQLLKELIENQKKQIELNTKTQQKMFRIYSAFIAIWILVVLLQYITH